MQGTTEQVAERARFQLIFALCMQPSEGSMDIDNISKRDIALQMPLDYVAVKYWRGAWMCS